jgi:hypothetical protein
MPTIELPPYSELVRRVEALESYVAAMRAINAAEAQAERERALNPPPTLSLEGLSVAELRALQFGAPKIQPQIPPEARPVVGLGAYRFSPDPEPAAGLRPPQAELLKAAEATAKPPEAPTLKLGDIMCKIDHPLGRIRFSEEFATEVLGIAPDVVAGQSKLYTVTSARCMLHELADLLASVADRWEF